MKTIILPGYSPHNRKWAYDTAKKVDLGHKMLVHEWYHWEKGSFSLKRELDKILEEVGKEKVNIIAKSVGVLVALKLTPKIFKQVNKLILCGTAGAAKEENKDLVEDVVNKIGAENIFCIQNEKDKFVPFEEAKKFYKSVNPKIKVVSKPRSDHHYPYYEEFQHFLK